MNITAQQRDWGSHGMSSSHSHVSVPRGAGCSQPAATQTEPPKHTEALLPSGQVSGYRSLGGPSIRLASAKILSLVRCDVTLRARRNL